MSFVSAIDQVNALSHAKIISRDKRVDCDDDSVSARLTKAWEHVQKQQKSQNPNASFNLSAEILAEDSRSFNGQYVQRHGQHVITATAINPSLGVAETRGERQTMEDEVVCKGINLTIGDNIIPAFLTAVFDGHGGSGASLLCKQHIVEALQKWIQAFNHEAINDVGMYNALKLACLDLHIRALDESGPREGTTATIALQVESLLWCANVGDSTSMLVDCNSYRTIQLTEDQSSTDPRFLSSITKRGLLCESDRVIYSHGRVAVPRSIGLPNFNPRPKITKFELPDKTDHLALVQHCDGVIETGASTNDVGRIVIQQLNRGRSPAVVATDLITVALQDGSTDNVSVLVRKLSSF